MGTATYAEVKDRMMSGRGPSEGDVWWVADVLVVVVESPSTKLFSSIDKRDQIRCLVVEDLDEVFSPMELVHFDLEDFDGSFDARYNYRISEATRRLMP